MKYRLFATGVVAAALIPLTGMAAPVDGNQAIEIAMAFRKAAPGRFKTVSSSTKAEVAYTAKAADENCFYVINTPAAGYTIVSADDRLPQVLGYSTTGEFDPYNIPCNMQWWLDNCRDEISRYLSSNPGNDKVRFEVPNRMPVEPITKTTWNQDAPYNNVCPLVGGQRSVTGCVATAMAQVMKVYNWPLRPEGTAFGFDFSGLTVDIQWDKMLDSYTGSYTEEEGTAVARLMRYCGIGVNMSYSPSASGAYSFNVGPAWTNNFGYDATSLRYHLREYYSQTEWNDLVYSELAQGRPIYYSGSSSQGGHAFVCDGYAGNGYFHFNWGWGGYQDGYFLLFSLNPGSGGIGSYDGGYNSNQSIYTGLIKRTDGVQKNQILMVGSAGIRYEKQNGVDKMLWGTEELAGLAYNPTGYTASLYIGLRLIDVNDRSKIYDYQMFDEAVDLPPLNGWRAMDFEIPSSVPDGSYELYLSYRGNDENEWNIVKSPYGTRQYISVSKSNGNVSYSNSDVKPTGKLVPGRLLPASEKLYGNLPLVFGIDVTNVDMSDDFTGTVRVEFAKSSNPTEVIRSYPFYFSIPSGITKRIDFARILGLEAGDYIVRVTQADNLVVDNSYELKLENGESNDIKGHSIYVDNVTAGLVDFKDAVTLNCTLHKTNSSEGSVPTQLSVNIFRASDNQPFGTLNLNKFALTDSVTTVGIGPFYVNSTIKIPGEYYWVISNVETIDGQSQKVDVSGKWPFTVYAAGQEQNGFVYDAFRTDNVTFVQLCAPRYSQFEGEVEIPETNGVSEFRRLGSAAFIIADKLTSLSIPGTITDICSGQFYGSTSLSRLDVRADHPMTLSKYAFAPGQIGGITLSVNDKAANLFKRAPQWNEFAFGFWEFTFVGDVELLGDLAIDQTTGKPYAPYYVSPEEQAVINVTIPNGKCAQIIYSINGGEEKTDYAFHPYSLPALNGANGKARIEIVDIPASVDEVTAIEGKADVYRLDGTLVGLGLEKSEITELPQGIYVVGSRKVIVR